MFHVNKYRDVLNQQAIDRGIKTMFGTELVAVDGKARLATFRTAATGESIPEVLNPTSNSQWLIYSH
jgi:hypothetical protein